MNVFDLIFSFAVGLVAGTAYFATLWLTISWFTKHRIPPAWLLSGAAFRLVLLIGVLFWIMDGQIERLFAALAGFFLVRIIALRQARAAGDEGRGASSIPVVPEASDATDAR